MEKRIIKFRGRDVITGNWAYGYYYPSKGNAIIRNEKDEECIVDPETVGQFTGMKDENGGGVYEGDSIKVEIEQLFDTVEKTGVVEYSDKDGQFILMFDQDGVSILLSAAFESFEKIQTPIPS